jgi:hypothetical protein
LKNQDLSFDFLFLVCQRIGPVLLEGQYDCHVVSPGPWNKLVAHKQPSSVGRVQKEQRRRE